MCVVMEVMTIMHSFTVMILFKLLLETMIGVFIDVQCYHNDVFSHCQTCVHVC